VIILLWTVKNKAKLNRQEQSTLEKKLNVKLEIRDHRVFTSFHLDRILFKLNRSKTFWGDLGVALHKIVES
jgi:hypothetical protein